MIPVRLVGELDRNFGWTGGRLLTESRPDLADPIPADLRGAYTSVTIAGNTARLMRDALGINKLFWGPGAEETVVVAARPHRLVRAGCPFPEIRAVASGSVIEYDPGQGFERIATLPAPERRLHSSDSPEAIAERIWDTLDRYCGAVAAANPQAPAYVCLSGGLDSSGALVLVRAHFSDVVAVSFDLDRGHEPPSADRLAAEQVARDLAIPLLPVTVTAEALLDSIDTALREGIDWRDFNVHAALVNVALARGIAAHAARQKALAPLVITGDLPNEFLCDYHPEEYCGRTFYALPRLRPVALQRVLVRGLETSHREVGPFQASGLAVVQVYAPAVDHYLALPEPFLADVGRKALLSRLIFGDRIPDYVYERPKTRAQIGDVDSGRGVLGACIDHGIDQTWLRRRFAELHDVSDPSGLEPFIRAGRYRSSQPRVGSHR